MAFSAHKNLDQLLEHESSEKNVRHLAKKVAEEIRNRKHVVAFTGAGISTSAGIPDFRGPQGVWTLQAQGKQRTLPTVSTIKALPTATHMALVGLAEAGFLKFLISQNTDGLHRRSGFPSQLLAELHGNTNLESCHTCKLDYLRDFCVRRRDNNVHEHVTDRKCTECGGPLNDTIINFGESLPSGPLLNGTQHSQLADVCLALGSSLTVSPANEMPKNVGERRKTLVVCNLQKTPLDHLAKYRVFAKTDIFMIYLMEELGLKIPSWRLRRRISLELEDNGKLTIYAVDDNNRMASLLRSVDIMSNSTTHPIFSSNEPHVFQVKPSMKPIHVTLNFYGHYQEPPFTFILDKLLPSKRGIKILSLSYMPGEQNWRLDEN